MTKPTHFAPRPSQLGGNVIPVEVIEQHETWFRVRDPQRPLITWWTNLVDDRLGRFYHRMRTERWEARCSR